MKSHLVVPACLLLLWTLTAPVSCNEDKKTTATEIKIDSLHDRIKVSCGVKPSDISLDYKDENTAEYPWCGETIYVKFRTCDNCVEFDMVTITGLAIGEVVATIVMGVAVYIIASKTQIGPTTSVKKSSDRQHLVPNAARGGASNDPYQALKPRQRDTYDELNRRR
ncbi:hypothetical protein OYC64_007552 [Pagothenia borchgrevinki]|uniref:Uncharacterized protein n=1 Tax=Pagothenia borchgrevinki TaxID=8213 RepID=A0ABD2GTE5_PAGBO